MTAMAVIGLMYRLVVLVGGVVGYAMKGSLPSILAGGAFGIALLASAWAMLKGKAIGWYAALGLAAALALFFGNRYWQEGVLMPAGLIAALSLLAAILFIVLPRRSA